LKRRKTKRAKRKWTRRWDPVLLQWRILDTARYYRRLTVRQLYYILISRFGYPSSLKFYKFYDALLVDMRRLNPTLATKFTDPTRHFTPAPWAYHEVELWVESFSIRNFVGDLASKYRLSIQVLRGFASLSMYQAALRRSEKQGVKMILYIGDFGPSGLLIDRIAQEEMGIKVHRIALTMEQIKRLRPPSIPVNKKDPRAKDYIPKYGDRRWQVEGLRPRTLYRILEEEIRKHVPPEYLVEAETVERAARMARPVTERLRRTVEKEALRLLKEGRSEEEILAQLASRYGIRTRRRRTNRSTGG